MKNWNPPSGVQLRGLCIPSLREGFDAEFDLARQQARLRGESPYFHPVSVIPTQKKPC